MNYIHEDYWSAQWAAEAAAEDYEFEKQRIELQNVAGVDMPYLGAYASYLDFVDCKVLQEFVPF